MIGTPPPPRTEGLGSAGARRSASRRDCGADGGGGVNAEPVVCKGGLGLSARLLAPRLVIGQCHRLSADDAVAGALAVGGCHSATIGYPRGRIGVHVDDRLDDSDIAVGSEA